MSDSVEGGDDLDGGRREVVGEVIARLAAGRGLVRGREEAALCEERNLLGFADLFEKSSCRSFEVAEARVGLLAGEFDPRG